MNQNENNEHKNEKRISFSFHHPPVQSRPVLVMALCTCVAFSAMVSYRPNVPEASTEEAVTEASVDETTEAATVSAVPETTEETTAALVVRYNPQPYLLNLANLYPEGSEKSIAQILLEELIEKDSRWYAQIYDMASAAPATVAPSLGRSLESVRGAYNPTSSKQSKDDPSTWSVEHFKNVKISFYNGKGDISSAVSNAQDILSMASVYAYYNGIEDLDTIRTYVNQLWKRSHSYSVSMGDVYYCDGCVDPKGEAAGEEDSELAGEDSFNLNSTIDTEITEYAPEEGTEEVSDDAADIGETDWNHTLTGTNSEKNASEHGSDLSASETESQTPASSVYEETTNPVLESLAETAESVYIEETEKAVQIIRRTTAAETSEPWSSVWDQETKAGETTSTASGTSGETERENSSPAQSVDSTASETSGVPETSGSAGAEPSSGDSGSDSPVSAAALNQVVDPVSAGNSSMGAAVYSAAIPQEAGNKAEEEDKKICPGHIDLKITAQIHSLYDGDTMYSIDQIGNTPDSEENAEEKIRWAGWTDRARAYVSRISSQDWTDKYGINVMATGTKAPLSSAEIETYMDLLPEGISGERQELIRFALQSVGKVPYYWGGKPSAQNYSGNHFGSVTLPDHKGRILKGLDCSGWISWVYWSALGTHLPYEGTEGLKETGKQISRADLQPGDLIVTTGSTPHVIMFLNWTENGQIQCIHETGSANNVTVSVMTADWPYYRNLLD